jgi:probable F420-dependent oxidoreductase
MFEQFGTVGVWRGVAELSPQLAFALEQLGYGTIWVGRSPGGDLKIVEDLLDATTSITVATGVVNIWRDEPGPIAAAYHRIEATHPGRVVLGIGVGHPEITGARYAKPYQALVEYLDALDEAKVPPERRVLAALGPKVLRLARDRSAGAHPYLTTPAHTRQAREILGPDRLLAPEQKVVLDADPDRARAIGRPTVQSPYLGLSNYRNNLTSLGYTEADLDNGGSDELIDALVDRGDPATVATAVLEHRRAGADHVAVQLLTAPDQDPLPQYAALARELFG